MPAYVYRCPACHALVEHWARMGEAPGTVACPHCQDTARRRFGAGVQINANPMALREENRLPAGTSQADIKAMRELDDRDYEESWNGRNPSSSLREAPPPLARTYRELTLEQVQAHTAALERGAEDPE